MLMKNKVQYIVVHSTQTLPFELHYAFPFNYIIHRSGRVITSKKITKNETSIHIAYIGGIDKDRNICDTRTEEQNEMLLSTLSILTDRYPNARIFNADEILGKSNNPGFRVRDWLKTYIPKSIFTAA